MIPALDQMGNPILKDDGTPLMKATKADMELRDYDRELGFWFRDPKTQSQRWYPLWRYMEAHERIATKRKDGAGGVSPFELNSSQIALYKAMCEMRREGKPIRINDGKSRQMGGSTFVAGVFFPLTAFVPGRKCGIVADVASHASGLFEKYTLLYETTPDYLKKNLRKRAKNAYELTFDYGRGVSSSIKVLVQGEGAGRSNTFDYLHESEIAFWGDIAGTCLALENTVGDTDMNSIIFRETTANGANEWKRMYDMGMQGRGMFKSVFMPWFLEDTYRMRYDGHTLTDREKELIEKHHLGLDQIQWWHSKWETAGQDDSKMAQEYPSDPTEMFVASGSGVFNSRIVSERKGELLDKRPLRRGYYLYSKSVSRDGGRIELSGIRWMEDPNGPVSIYKEPDPTHPYIMVNDPAMGGEDYWATQLIDNSDCSQCATFHKRGCDADEATFQSYCLWKEFHDESGRVMVAGETNTTAYFVNTMKRLGVKDVYVDRDTEAISGRMIAQYGYKTKQSNRQRMIDDLVIAFRESGGRIVSDFDTICEMESFSYVKSGRLGKEKAMADGGAHDDLVMAYAGFFLVRNSYSASIRESQALRKRDVGFDPLKRKDTKKVRAYMTW